MVGADHRGLVPSGFLGLQADEGLLGIDGSIRVGSVSLGWFSPIRLCNVDVLDENDQCIIQIEKIESDRCLLHLLVHREDRGSFRIEKPRIEWTVAGNESNLEKFLALFFLEPTAEASPGAESASELPHLHLQIVDGTVSIQDCDTNQFWKIHTVGLSALVFRDASRTVQLNLQGSLHDGIETGTVKAEIHLQNMLAANPQVTVKGRFSSLPLALASTLARRWQPGIKLAGSLQGHCHLVAAIKDGKPFVDASGELTGNQVSVESPILKEPLYLERLTAPYQLRLEDEVLVVERAEFDSEIGKASLKGSFDLSRENLAG